MQTVYPRPAVIARSGSPWRYLPKRYGKWYTRDSIAGVAWEFGKDPDLEHLILDSTVVRAHPWAAAKKGEQALGRSRGGYSTQIHVSVDGLGKPLVFRITAGQSRILPKQRHYQRVGKKSIRR